MVLVSQLAQEKKEKDVVQRNVEMLIWEQWKKDHGKGMDGEIQASMYCIKSRDYHSIVKWRHTPDTKEMLALP